jgi:hypothetical protein
MATAWSSWTLADAWLHVGDRSPGKSADPWVYVSDGTLDSGKSADPWLHVGDGTLQLR